MTISNDPCLWVNRQGQRNLTIHYFLLRNIGDLLNIKDIHFEQMVQRIYPTELRLNKANASDADAEAVLDLSFSIHNDAVSAKMYDKLDDLILLISRSLMSTIA